MIIHVNDKMQQNYTYELNAPMGEKFNPRFTPAFTPKEMLALGVFEGHYLNDCRTEFPADWFEGASLSPQKPNINRNYFHIKSRLPLSEWQKRGWILEPDPRGWFQWYCRYYMGRRLLDIDDKQIKRWLAFKRHLAQVEKNCNLMDLSCRARQRQALLQWAYNPIF